MMDDFDIKEETVTLTAKVQDINLREKCTFKSSYSNS